MLTVLAGVKSCKHGVSREHFRKFPVKSVKFASSKDFRFQDFKDFSNEIRDFQACCGPLEYKIGLCRNSYCNTISRSSFISSATRTARPLIKLKSSVFLVLYNWLNGFYRLMDGKYSIILLFFGSNTRHASLLRPRPSTVSIANAVQRN